MSARRLALSFLCVLGASCAGATPAPAPSESPVANVVTEAHPTTEPYPELAAAFDTIVASGFRGVVLFRAADGPTRLFIHGDADCVGQAPITRATRFDIGSITKQLTGAAILRLVEQDRLSLDTRLGDIFSNAPSDKAGITVTQLLMHTSGLPDSLGADEEYISKTDYLALAFAAALLTRPGETEEYSNVGYSVLGAIIEQITGQRYEAALRDLVLTPAGVPGIGYMTGDRARNACGLLDGARWGSTRDYFGADEPSWHLTGNGGLLATPEELTQWFDAVFAGRVLNAESLALFTDAIEATDRRGRTLRYTSGSNNIFSSLYLTWPGVPATMMIMTSDSRFQKEGVTPVMFPAFNAYTDRISPPAPAETTPQ